MMVIVLNIMVWFFILSIPFLLIRIIRAQIRKKKNKSLYINISILVGMLLLLAIFYSPTRLTLPDPQQLLITLDARNQDLTSLMNDAQINELVMLVERQRLVKSTTKTLGGTLSYPAENGINIMISGKDEPFHLYIFARNDDIKRTFFEIKGQYYTVLETKSFVEDILELCERIKR
ncbi:hypothetical protein [Cohnella sp.]|uniref:hypothetical protein n=1 Tax=Cohnella sp. TaxID=1883426 RepID=UPI00356A0BFF